MLRLTNIVKNYKTGDTTVSALKGINLEFRENEFVSILGHSGCGKTTLLNLIGGLDQYTSGDLFISGISTKRFKDSDWDTYRNHSVGFVFQSYNLIPHQSVLSNVELALTLSGVSKSERRARAKHALEKVGLGDQIHKKPNQMSGGQMQRVAIARALVNNPDILLADEPTGALDTETSTQIMEILKEIAQEKLVIMVTHNPELAVAYSNRIIRLVDGLVTDDSNPYLGPVLETEIAAVCEEPKLKEPKKQSKKIGKKKSMSFITALSLSLNNLLTKKARTVLTSFAGSIGIIGIAMILALSNGIQLYINQVQEDTLSSYPITIQAKSEDIANTILSIMSENNNSNHDLNAVYSSPVLNKMINSLTNPQYSENNLKLFKEYLESEDNELVNYTSNINYVYDVDFSVFFKDENGKIIESDPTKLMQETIGMSMDGMGGMTNLMSSGNSMKIYEQLLSDDNGLISDIVYEQYDLISGNWPKNYNEVVLVVNSNNEISDFALLALGLTTTEEAKNSWQNIGAGEEISTEIKKWSYEKICNMTFKVVPACNFYSPDPVNGGYKDISTTESGLAYMYDNGIEIKISGIIRPNPDASAAMLTGTVGYTKSLVDKVIEITDNSRIVIEQKANPNVDVITGLPFKASDYTEPTEQEKLALFKEYIKGLTTAQKAELYKKIASTPSAETVSAEVERQMKGLTRQYIETMMLDSYAQESGMDKETLKNYISGLSDEELFGQVRMMLEERIATQMAQMAEQQLSQVPQAQLAAMLTATVNSYSAKEGATAYDEFMPAAYSDSTYDNVLVTLGVVSLDSPSAINLYASTFSDKDKISDCIAKYNETVDEEDRITYTDYVAILMSSITTIINVISYVLIAFVAISLVVSSIMIGIITYISVLERTKEIGILRAIGASKRDVSRVFNAETLIVGFAAGLIGIVTTLVLCVPVNIIIRSISGIENIGAQLPVAGAIILVIISMALTFIAGLIPSGIASKKDPVEALRTE